MASTGALPQTLRSITDTKIKELSKQRVLFEKRRANILKSAADASDLRSKAQVLLEGITRLKGYPDDAFDREDLDSEEEDVNDSSVQGGTERAAYVNIRRFLLQRKYDPSVSDRNLINWIAQLEEELQFLHLRHEHASFYSNLVTEWLESIENESLASPGDDDKSASSDFEPVGRAEMHEQRATWESLAFNAADMDTQAIRAYLDVLFTQTNLSRQALKNLREKVKAFGTDLAAQKTWFSKDDLNWVSNSLLRSDLLTKEKTIILKEFMRNPSVAQEVADVLNMRLASLENWSWPVEGVPMEMRRQLHGKYRVFMDEDLLDALLFQYLGLKWAVTFRGVFQSFLDSHAWRSPGEHVPKKHLDRRRYFVNTSSPVNVNDLRQQTYKADYFMTRLPSSVTAGVPSYGDDDSDIPDEKQKNPLETKHALLHLLITESIIHTTLHGGFTAVQSDFKWFGPGLPHSTMLTVLSYFGVPETWLNFFKTFLEAPLKFVQDGPDAKVQVRQRGIPMSHILSDCFGEAILFCMDYAVNQRTNGAYLYRLHDDFWIWGQEETCVQGWDAMSEFARVMGLEFNEEKTGTVRMESKTKKKTNDKDFQDKSGSPAKQAESEAPTALPEGDVRWGFLKLDSQEGRFIIDQEQVDSHISELQRQLSSCKSVFSWVQAWNGYFGRFFSNNFAKPAMCFGRAHIDMAIATLSRIERTLFPDSASGVTDHLRSMIAQRYDVHDLPDGFFYFPVQLGGLGLLNPYISLLAMREAIKQTPQGRLQKARVEDEADYHAAKENFERNGPARPEALGGASMDSSAFMPLEEYTQYAETFSRPLKQAYLDLTRVPEEISIDRTKDMRRNQMSLDETVINDTRSGNVISDKWFKMSPYWKWTAELYQTDMVKTYGSLAAISRQFMPLGVVETLKEGRFRWQG